MASSTLKLLGEKGELRPKSSYGMIYCIFFSINFNFTVTVKLTCEVKWVLYVDSTVCMITKDVRQGQSFQKCTHL